MTTLMPQNSTHLECALDAIAARISLAAPPIDTMLNPATCPPAFLPWLAWSLSVDHWDATWPDERKREVIAASINLHRRKGTIWAMRHALQVAGLGDAELIENFGNNFWNGAVHFDGAQNFASPDHWAEYRVRLARPITAAQAETARRILQEAAPARCHLKALDFTQAQNLFNAAITFDGSNTHGVA